MTMDDTEDGIELKIETTLSKEKRMECRQIVQEIRNFRVSQRQILYLIQLLALELENRESMQSIINSVKENREKEKPLLITEEESSVEVKLLTSSED
jgi:hypothetical protein